MYSEIYGPSVFEHYEPRLFVTLLSAAEMHWHFYQGVQAAQTGLYIPAVSSLLNGIEATLRVTLSQQKNGPGLIEPSPYKCLSNNLLLDARAIGMQVELLAFPNELDFEAKLISQKPARKMVEIVRVRNNLCHGNVFEFINTDLGEGNAFFTPECLEPLCVALIDLSYRWCDSVSEFRANTLPKA